jgi:hypothetical protein
MNLSLLIENNMPFHHKLMVLVRWVIIISVLAYILTMNTGYLYGGAMVIILLLAGFLYRNLEGMHRREGFLASNDVFSMGGSGAPTAAPAVINISAGKEKAGADVSLDALIAADYHHEDWHNPFGNMLLPEIKYDTDRKSAPPAFNPSVAEQIRRNVKKAVQKLNPGIQNTDKQLFGDLYNNFVLDNANRAFYSMPSTRVENDQSAFAQFLYHDLIYSGKESTPEGAMARVQDNYRYTLY